MPLAGSLWIPAFGYATRSWASEQGVAWMQVAAGGYGDTKEKIIGVSVLAIGILLFLFRRIVQDKESPHWREETPAMPDAHVAKLLEDEMTPV